MRPGALGGYPSSGAEACALVPPGTSPWCLGEFLETKIKSARTTYVAKSTSLAGHPTRHSGAPVGDFRRDLLTPQMIYSPPLGTQQWTETHS